MPVDATTSASSVINNYDGDLDELMNAIAAYTNRQDGGAVVPNDGSSRTPWDSAGRPTTMTREEDNLYRATSDGQLYSMGIDGGGNYTWTRVSGLEVNGQPMNAATIEKPGFQLTAASVTNDITTNIGFISKSIADKNNWLSMIRNAVGR